MASFLKVIIQAALGLVGIALLGVGVLEGIGGILQWIGFGLINIVSLLFEGKGTSISTIFPPDGGGYSLFAFHGLPSAYAGPLFFVLGCLALYAILPIELVFTRLEQVTQARQREQDRERDAEQYRQRRGDKQEQARRQEEEYARREQQERQRAEQERDHEQKANPPETDLEKKYAKVLGLSGKVTSDDVKRCWRELSMQYHPDRVQHLGPKLKEVAEQEMKALNEAYEYFKTKYDI